MKSDSVLTKWLEGHLLCALPCKEAKKGKVAKYITLDITKKKYHSIKVQWSVFMDLTVSFCNSKLGKLSEWRTKAWYLVKAFDLKLISTGLKGNGNG